MATLAGFYCIQLCKVSNVSDKAENGDGDKNTSASGDPVAQRLEDRLENEQPDNDNNLNVEKELRDSKSAIKPKDGEVEPDSTDDPSSKQTNVNNSNSETVKSEPIPNGESSGKHSSECSDQVEAKPETKDESVEPDSTSDKSGEKDTNSSSQTAKSDSSSSGTCSADPSEPTVSGSSSVQPSGSGVGSSSSSSSSADCSEGPSGSSAGSSGPSGSGAGSSGPSGSGAGPSGSSSEAGSSGLYAEVS